MGFSVKLAPGVRVRASSRGVRTSLGPRVARVHAGGGRTGLSTGIGPIGFSTTVGGPGRRGTSTGSVNRQMAAVARQQELADKAAEARRLDQAFDAIFQLHREEFAPVQRPEAPLPPDPPAARIRSLHRDHARRTTSIFDRTARRSALAAADRRAENDVAGARTQLAEQHAMQQTQLTAAWEALNACEPEATLQALGEAFADNAAAASAVGIEGTEASLVVFVPPVTDVPDRKATITAAGNLSLKKLTKTETAELYQHLVCGHVLATLREAFAVAPGVQSARIVAVRGSGSDAFGRTRVEVIAAARCSRFALAGVHWERADAVTVFGDSCTEQVMIRKGATRALQPVPLKSEPELRALVDAIDLSEAED